VLRGGLDLSKRNIFLTLILVEKTGELKTLNVKDYKEDELFKKCGFKKADGFSKQYNVINLVYYEMHETAQSAITREKRLKKYKREQKIALIEKENPEWEDLYEKLF
jgi:putative endonuclease